MKTKVALATCVLLAGAILMPGCKKQPEPAPAPAEKSVEKTTPTTEQVAAAQKGTDQAAKEQIAAAVEQTTCPVMGGVLNKDIFVEYKGKKVYFCCDECKGRFEKEPEKYLAKLPQFKEQ